MFHIVFLHLALIRLLNNFVIIPFPLDKFLRRSHLIPKKGT